GVYTDNAPLIIVNSTFSGNQAQLGGGISNTGNLTLRNATITQNVALHFGFAGGLGAGIYHQNGLLNLGNTIISGNLPSTDTEIYFESGTIISAGNNLVGDSVGDSTNTGNPINYQATDIRDTPPKL